MIEEYDDVDLKEYVNGDIVEDILTEDIIMEILESTPLYHFNSKENEDFYNIKFETILEVLNNDFVYKERFESSIIESILNGKSRNYICLK